MVNSPINTEEKIRIGLSSKLIGFITRTPSELIERRKNLMPIYFPRIFKDDFGDYHLIRTGEIVYPISFNTPKHIKYNPNPDVMPYALWCKMTEDKFSDKYFKANAVYIFPEIIHIPGKDLVIQKYQPMIIPQEVYEKVLAS
jgi:hypothetical protein